MEKIRPTLALIFVLLSLTSFINKDRLERPKTYKFVFQNRREIRLDNPNDSILQFYNNDIINGKRKLVRADLLFATGETLTFKNDGTKWTEIKITDGKNTISVPDTTIAKIPEIHFATIALLWHGTDKQAFSADYFYISFDIGFERYFNKYLELDLEFSGQKFSGSTIQRQIDENSTQWTDF